MLVKHARRTLGVSTIGVSIALFSLVACKNADSGESVKAAIDADPLALLPSSALIVAHLDGRAVAAAGSSGLSLDDVTALLLPLGDDAGLRPSRDIDDVVVGGYGGASNDVVAVFTGRFDPDAIAHATRGRSGAPVVASRYVGFATYAVGSVVLSPLTRQTLVSGTQQGVRRLLERVRDGQLQRAMPPWVATTVETKGATWALAADFAAQPIAVATVGSVSIPWVKGMQSARVVGALIPPQMNVAATLTYGSPDEAQSAAQGVHLVDGWLSVLAPLIGGMTLQNLNVAVDGQDLRGTFSVDDHTLRTIVSLAPRVLPALSR